MLREIGGRAIGRDAPGFAIAEIGLNHGGSLDRALAMVDRAAAAGASAIKLQTIRADRLLAADCSAPAHVKAASLREFFSRFELDWNAHRAIAARARKHGLAVMTTPFSEDAISPLVALGFDAFKIASGDLTYDGLIAAAAATGKPLVLSTGMSDSHDVGHALDVARRARGSQLALLHCVSAYPTPAASENLRVIETLARTFGVPTGLSDHGRGLLSAVAAVTLGACLYERHFVLAGDDDAIDRAVSSTPEEFAAIVTAMNETRVALGDGVRTCQSAERPNVASSRRGLYATRTLRAGDTVESSDVAVLRPASSLCPSQVADLVGVTLRRPIVAGEAFSRCDLASGSAA